MVIQIQLLKKVIEQIENTIYPDDQTKLIVPILSDDLNDLQYDGQTVRTYNLYFERQHSKGEWSLII